MPLTIIGKTTIPLAKIQALYRMFPTVVQSIPLILKMDTEKEWYPGLQNNCGWYERGRPPSAIFPKGVVATVHIRANPPRNVGPCQTISMLAHEMLGHHGWYTCVDPKEEMAWRADYAKPEFRKTMPTAYGRGTSRDIPPFTDLPPEGFAECCVSRFITPRPSGYAALNSVLAKRIADMLKTPFVINKMLADNPSRVEKISQVVQINWEDTDALDRTQNWWV